jgi:beta-lactamase regulating signal transducer with metallopeptidase domain
MRSLSEIAGEFAMAQLWQVTLVIGVAGLVTRLCCRRRPHLAHLIWLVVVIKCLTPPLWSSPTGIFSWAMTRGDVPTDANSRRSPATLTSANWQLSSPVDREAAGDVKHPPAASVALDAEPALPTLPAPPSSATVSLWAPRNVASWFWTCWAAGALAYVALATLATIGCGRTIRRSRLPCDGTLIATVNRLAERLRIRGKTRLVLLSEPLGPLTFGWFRPTIVIPHALIAGHSTADFEPIVAHELMHIRRGDAFVGLLQIAAQCIWWFHPFVWWANRQMTRERERCCDEEVISGLAVPPAAYARSLVNVLELKRQLRWLSPLPGLRQFEVTKQRLEHLMQNSAGFRERMPRAYWLLLLVGVLVLAPGAGLARSTDERALTNAEAGPPLVAVEAAQVAGQAVSASALMKQVYESFAWIDRVRTFQIRAEYKFQYTSEQLRWEKEHPEERFGRVQKSDPRAYCITSEWAWDQSRIRYWYRNHYLDGPAWQHTKVWDGSLVVSVDEESDHANSRYCLGNRYSRFFTENEVTNQLMMPWGPGGPHQFWWLPTNVDLSHAERGDAPGDFVAIGEESSGGRPCYVLESRTGGYRMYVGKADGRLYRRTFLYPFGTMVQPDLRPVFEKVAGSGVKTYEKWQSERFFPVSGVTKSSLAIFFRVGAVARVVDEFFKLALGHLEFTQIIRPADCHAVNRSLAGKPILFRVGKHFQQLFDRLRTAHRKSAWRDQDQLEAECALSFLVDPQLACPGFAGFAGIRFLEW